VESGKKEVAVEMAFGIGHLCVLSVAVHLTNSYARRLPFAFALEHQRIFERFHAIAAWICVGSAAIPYLRRGLNGMA